MCLELPVYQRLDDEQKDVHDMDLMGRYLVEGPPGTGKSVVALHRVAKFARNNQPVTLLMFNRPLMEWTKKALDKALTAAGCTAAQRKLVTTKTTETWFPKWYSTVLGDSPPMRSNPKKPTRNIPTKYAGTCAVCNKPTSAGQDRAVSFGKGWKAVHPACLDALSATEGYSGVDWGPNLLTHAGKRMEQALRTHGATLNLVIDEGQDLSNSFYSIVSHFCSSLTVYADEAQIVSEEKSLPSEIARLADIETGNRKRLRTNYRNRAEVAHLAASFRPKRDEAAIAQKTRCTEQPVISGMKSMDALEQHVRTLHSNFGQKSIGVFFKFNGGKEGRDKFAEKFAADEWAQVYVDFKSRIDMCAPGVFIANTGVAKGLEFDIVILADLQNWPSEPTAKDDGQFYVLLSRSRDILQITYVGEDEPPLLGNPRYKERFKSITHKRSR